MQQASPVTPAWPSVSVALPVLAGRNTFPGVGTWPGPIQGDVAMDGISLNGHDPLVCSSPSVHNNSDVSVTILPPSSVNGMECIAEEKTMGLSNAEVTAANTS